MPSEAFYLGIDIGGTHTKLGLISYEGKIIRKSKFESFLYQEPDEYLDRLVNEIKLLWTDSVALSNVIGIGIGAPTANYHTGKIEAPANIPWSKSLNIKAHLELLLELDVFLTNDANLAALGELHFGWGQKYANLLVITLGTGLGAGIIVENQLVHGKEDLAGELGHTTLIPGGRPCNCGKDGCLEAYVSIRGLMQNFKTLNKSSQPELSPFEIFEQAQDSNELALSAIQQTAEYLGLGLANAAVTIAPECIVISGGLAGMGGKLLTPAIESFEKHILKNLRGKIPLKISEFANNDLSLIGAAMLVKEHQSNIHQVKN